DYPPAFGGANFPTTLAGSSGQVRPQVAAKPAKASGMGKWIAGVIVLAAFGVGAALLRGRGEPASDGASTVQFSQAVPNVQSGSMNPKVEATAQLASGATAGSAQAAGVGASTGGGVGDVAGVNAGAGQGTNAGAGVNVGAGASAAAGAGANAGAGTNAGAGVNVGAGASAAAGAGTNAGAGENAGAGANAGAG